MITILAGGTGSVKLVRGLVSQEPKVNVISNVGDNYWLYGLYICPDIDTIVYGLADLLDQERGWGIKKTHSTFCVKWRFLEKKRGLELETEMLQQI